MHVQGELLISGRSYDGRGASAARRGQDRYAKPYLDELGLEARDVECEELHGRVLRLTSPGGIETQRLADVARNLRMRGFVASLTNITPTAGVIKPPPSGPVAQAASAVQSAAAAERAPGGSAPRSGRGMPVKVAIIDTGITAEDRTYGWLKTVPRPPADIDPLTAFPLPASDPYLDLDAGHGTFVAGLVQRVAPDAEITVYRAIDSDCIASEVAVACEMIRAVKNGAQIVNLSLGCQTPDDTPPIAIAAALEIIRERERETGHQVLVVAAAGNYGDSRPCWPAAFRGRWRPSARHDAYAVFQPWLLGHLFHHRPRPALDVRRGAAVSSGEPAGRGLRTGLLGGVERHVLHRAASHGRTCPAVSGRRPQAARGAAQAAGRGRAPAGLRPGPPDPPKRVTVRLT